MEFDGIAVEIDECLHFNRYRGITLQSAAYSRLEYFPLDAYRDYCERYEQQCLRASWGGRWASKSSEAQFGKSSEPRDLSGNGSSRWRQRAFYDFVKDISHSLIRVRVARVAVWDVLEGGGAVGELLGETARSKPPNAAVLAFARLIKQRAEI